MRGVCRAVFWLYCGLSIVALLLIPISRWGLFGVEPDPLSAVFAVLLAQPWPSLADRFISGEAAGWAVVILGMAVNAAIIALLCRLAGRKRRAFR